MIATHEFLSLIKMLSGWLCSSLHGSTRFSSHRIVVIVYLSCYLLQVVRRRTELTINCNCRRNILSDRRFKQKIRISFNPFSYWIHSIKLMKPVVTTSIGGDCTWKQRLSLHINRKTTWKDLFYVNKVAVILWFCCLMRLSLLR